MQEQRNKSQEPRGERCETRRKRQEARGRSQEARGKRPEARGKRQETRHLLERALAKKRTAGAWRFVIPRHFFYYIRVSLMLCSDVCSTWYINLVINYCWLLVKLVLVRRPTSIFAKMNQRTINAYNLPQTNIHNQSQLCNFVSYITNKKNNHYINCKSIFFHLENYKHPRHFIIAMYNYSAGIPHTVFIKLLTNSDSE